MADRPLRVAITARAVAPWHGRGGLERHVADLVRHLARLGVEVSLIVPPPHATAASRISAPDENGAVTIYCVPYLTFPGAGRRGTTILDRDTAYPFFGWRAGRMATRLAAAGRIDIVHGLGASVLGYALAKRRHGHLPPLVMNPQGLEEFGATDPQGAGLKRRAYWPLQRAVRACARAADAVIATDEVLVPMVTRHLDVPRDRVPVVPNAVDVQQCDAWATAVGGRQLRQARGIGDGTALLLSVGRLEQNKGFHLLVAALARLGSHPPDWKWALVGDGPHRTILDGAVEKAGLGSRMLRIGSIGDDELHAWYEAADLFVHPTLYEGSSLVTLEAMAHRLPVVATSAGGLPDKVTPGTSGWLVPPGDVGALAETLREAMACRSRWPEMGTAGRLAVERSFAWPAVVRRLETLYRTLLEHPQRRGDDRHGPGMA
jgi:glycosyltransferase involved in cell wall biosynthesis